MNSRFHKPKKCCHPDCFHCPYVDCRWDELTSSDMSETNNRDYQLYEESTGEKYHKGTDNEYRAERERLHRKEHPVKRDRSEYNKQYYLKNKERIKKKRSSSYDTDCNTKQCKKWRKSHMEYKKEYDRKRYLQRKAELKPGGV